MQKRVRFWARVPEAASKSGQKWGVCPSHSPQKGVFQQPPRSPLKLTVVSVPRSPASLPVTSCHFLGDLSLHLLQFLPVLLQDARVLFAPGKAEAPGPAAPWPPEAEAKGWEGESPRETMLVVSPYLTPSSLEDSPGDRHFRPNIRYCFSLLDFELLMEHHAPQSSADSLIDVPFAARSSIAHPTSWYVKVHVTATLIEQGANSSLTKLH